MVRKVYLWIVFVLLGGGMAFSQSAGYNFTVTVTGMPAGQVRLIGTVGDRNFLADSAEVSAAGAATFTGAEALHGGLYYLVYPGNKFLQILVDKDQEFSLATNASDLVGKMKVEGSLDNELLYQNLKFETEFQEKYKAADAKVNAAQPGTAARTDAESARDAVLESRKAHLQHFQDTYPESFFTVFKIAGQNPDLTYPKKPNGDLDTLRQVWRYRMDYWENTDLTDERLLYTPIIHNKLKTYMGDILDQKIDSVIKYADIVIGKSMGNKEMFKFILNWIAIKYHKSTIMGGEKIFVHLVDNYFTEELAFWSSTSELEKIKDEANEKRVSMLGMIGKDLNCPNVNGQMESLYALNAPITVLYIYSYDCDHCKKRTPVMQQVFDKWKDKGLEVYALCVENEEAKWKAFIENYGVQGWHNVWDPKYQSRYYYKYHIDITPEVYVLDKDHKIIAKDLHPNQLEPILKRELQ